MPPENSRSMPPENSGRWRSRIWRATVADTLGFSSFSELTEKSGIPPGNMSRICRGIDGLSDRNAHKLIEAIFNRNYQKGWDYLESAIQLAESLNFLRSHSGHFEERDVRLIEDEDVKRWYCYYLETLKSTQTNLDKQLEIIRISSDTKTNLENTLALLKSWNMKHDFYYLDHVKDKFKQSKSIIIPSIKRGMAENFYENIKAIFTEIRHIAHLCEEFEFVTEMSEWLIKTFSSTEDIYTQIKAKTTLAWTFTSNGQRQNLCRAQVLTQELWRVITDDDFIESMPCEDIDVIAILCELRLRLPIRLYEKEMRSLTDDKFNNLFQDSRRIIKKIKKLESLELRLKLRFEIPLLYQKGIYLYRKERYEDSRKEFKRVACCANLIGWGRVEQAAYSWLATASEKIGEKDLCLTYLGKIDGKHLPKISKRLCIRDKLYSEMKG